MRALLHNSFCVVCVLTLKRWRRSHVALAVYAVLCNICWNGGQTRSWSLRLVMDITVRLAKDLLFAYYIRNVPKLFVSIYHPNTSLVWEAEQSSSKRGVKILKCILWHSWKLMRLISVCVFVCEGTDTGLCLRWLCLLWPKYSLMCAVMAQTKQPPQKQLHWLLGFKEIFIIT